jgi:hypothetical protein
MTRKDHLGELHINVAAGGIDPEIESLRPELRMVKAALLYADSVTLTSPKLTVLQHFAAVAPADAERRKAIDESGITEKQGWSAAITIREGLRRGHQPSPHELEWMQKFEAELALYDRFHEEQIERTLVAAGGDELEPAVRSGLVQLRPIVGNVTDPAQYADDVADEFEEVFREALDAEGPTYPLFDFTAWLSLRPAVTASGVSSKEMGPASEVALAADLIVDKVEAFPDATMDVVLDVRQRLRDPLVRFRSALAKAAAELESTGFDDNFEREAQSLYRREVEPALLELQESLADLGARETLRRGAEGGVAALGVAAAGAAMFRELIAAAAVPLGMAGQAELKHRREAKKTRRENNYFFIWEADRLLRRAQAASDRRHIH